ncbi:MAG: hypothetical protein WDN49_12390 [Acetobacteraceae bacterium]
MISADLARGATRLRDAIEACGVLRLASRLRPGSAARPSPAELLGCFSAFSADYATFGVVEHLVMEQLDLHGLADAAWWSRLVLAVRESSPDAAILAEWAALDARLRLAAETLPKLLALLQPVEAGQDSLTLVLPVQDGALLQPRRLSWALESISLLWDALCALEGAPSPLVIAACDPAATMTVRFAGAPTIMATLKTLLLTLRHDFGLEEQIANLPQALSTPQHRAAPPGQAAALRRMIEDGARRFIAAGASILDRDGPPEALLMDDAEEAHIDALVAAERRLLDEGRLLGR